MRARTPMPEARRRRLAGLTALTLALVVSGLATVMSPAQAGTTPPYNIDGNVPDAAIQSVQDPFGNSQELGPVNGTSTKLGAIHSAGLPMLATTNPNGQVDLRRIWLDTKKDTAPDQDTWLYLGWERDSSNGSGVIMYEFMQDPAPAACDYSLPTQTLIATCNPWRNRKAGDFVLVWDQVGSSVKIILRAWQDIDPGPAVNLKLSAGTTLNSNLAQARMSTDGFRGEGAVNLSDTVFSQAADRCLSFGNVVPGTVTGNSDTADYKDTVLADVSGFVNISNCGAVRVSKVTVPANGTGAFGYTLDRGAGAAIRYAADGYAGSEVTSATGTLTEDGDAETVIDLIAGSGYRLDEAFGAGTPYDKTSIVCTTEGGQSYTLFSTAPGAVPVSAFPVIAGETTDCVITNTLERGTLVVVKDLTNDDGGTKAVTDFAFKVNGGSATPFEADGSNEYSVNEGTYSVVEDGLPIAGYSTSYRNSVNSAADCANLFVPAGGTVTCTISNDDEPGRLVVKKVLVNDNGGSKTVTDFAFEVNGGSAESFEADAENQKTVAAGTYSVLEDGLPITGYDTTYANSENSNADCANLEVGLGRTVTCTITNDDRKAQPTGTTNQTWVLHDELTLTGVRAGGSPAASVEFRLYDNATCSGTPITEADPTITGGKASTTDGITVTESGTYYWRAHYSGDSFNEPFTTACGEEITQVLAKDEGRNDF